MGSPRIRTADLGLCCFVRSGLPDKIFRVKQLPFLSDCFQANVDILFSNLHYF